MRQEIATPTKGMVRLGNALGRPVEEIIRQRYTVEGASMPEIAAELRIDVSTLSRWMKRLDIPVRIFASERPERVA